MDLHRVHRLLATTRKIAFAAALLSTLLAISAIAAHRFAIMSDGAAAGNGVNHSFPVIDRFIDPSTIADRTKGKSLFRTMQPLDTKVVDELGRYELRGVSQRGGVFKAYVKDTKGQKTHILKVGDMLGNIFEVEEIESREITLKRGDEEVKLKKG
jgi:hypothetical protein